MDQIYCCKAYFRKSQSITEYESLICFDEPLENFCSQTVLYIKKSICAMANLNRGLILIGVQKWKVLGLEITEDEKESFKKLINRLCDNHIYPMLSVSNKQVVVDYPPVLTAQNMHIKGLYLIRIKIQSLSEYLYSFKNSSLTCGFYILKGNQPYELEEIQTIYQLMQRRFQRGISISKDHICQENVLPCLQQQIFKRKNMVSQSWLLSSDSRKSRQDSSLNLSIQSEQRSELAEESIIQSTTVISLIIDQEQRVPKIIQSLKKIMNHLKEKVQIEWKAELKSIRILGGSTQLPNTIKIKLLPKIEGFLNRQVQLIVKSV